MRTNNEKNFYFRSIKNSYQQGEQISVIGKPIIDSNIVQKVIYMFLAMIH